MRAAVDVMKFGEGLLQAPVYKVVRGNSILELNTADQWHHEPQARDVSALKAAERHPAPGRVKGSRNESF